MNGREKDVMMHALGFSRPRRWAYRNYFAAGDIDGKIWDGLVKQGLARAHGNLPSEIMPYPCYSVTQAGIEALGIRHKVPQDIFDKAA